MDLKVCTKCGVEKSLSEFSKGNDKNGLQYKCKECNKEYKNENNVENKEYNKIWHKEYYKNNRESKLEYQKEYQIINEEKIHEYKKVNEEHIKEQKKEWRKANVESINIKSKKHYQDNIEYYKEHNKKYQKERKLIDPLFKLTCNIRTLINISLKNGGFKKTSKTAYYLGCTYEEFFIHIEKQFVEGMDWTNRSLWHLDHIYPVSLAESEEHLIQLNRYTNFQPLWAIDNIRKGNKIL